MKYVLKVVCYNTILAPSKNNTIKVYVFKYLLSVQGFLVKLN